LRRSVDLKRNSALDQAILHAFGGRFHGFADIDRTEIEGHGPGVDAGEIEDVVDDGKERVGRYRYVAEVFALLVRERAGSRISQEIREADDVGERRAQLIGYMVNEVSLELVRRLQGFVTLAQGALDINRVGDILERHQRGAIGERHGGAIDDAAVAPLEPAECWLAVVDRRDRAA